MKWIYYCSYCKHKWEENRGPVSTLPEIILGNFAKKSKVLRATLCPRCGKVPKRGFTKDGKQGVALITK